MAKKANRRDRDDDDPLLSEDDGRPRPKRNRPPLTEVVSIGAEIRTALAEESAEIHAMEIGAVEVRGPMTSNNVRRLGRIRQKSRYEFDDDVTHALHVQIVQAQATILAATKDALAAFRADTLDEMLVQVPAAAVPEEVEVEVPAPPPVVIPVQEPVKVPVETPAPRRVLTLAPKPVPERLPEREPEPPPTVGASPSTLDESEQLAAYLAHHEPMGATKKIKTLPGKVVLRDGTVIHVPCRQDDEDAGPYAGYQYDGLVTVIDWTDLEGTRKRAARATKDSQAQREAHGKNLTTRHQNLVRIHEYRPVPTVRWFLGHPDGTSYLRGDKVPYPYGYTPQGQEGAEYRTHHNEHFDQILQWREAGQDTSASERVWDFDDWCQRTCRQATKDTAKYEEYTLRRMDLWHSVPMSAHDRREANLSRVPSKAELLAQNSLNKIDKEWEDSSDDIPWSYSAALPKHEAANDSAQVSETQRADGTSEVKRTAMLARINRRAQFGLGTKPQMKVQSMRNVLGFHGPVFVSTEGVATIAGQYPESEVIEGEFTVIEESTQPQAPGMESEGIFKMTLPLTDPEAQSFLGKVETQLLEEVNALLDKLSQVHMAQRLADRYQRTGTFVNPDLLPKNAMLDRIHAQIEQDQVQDDVLIEPTVYHHPARYMVLADLIEEVPVYMVLGDLYAGDPEAARLKEWLQDKSLLNPPRSATTKGGLKRNRLESWTEERARIYANGKRIRTAEYVRRQADRVWQRKMAALQPPHEERVEAWAMAEHRRKLRGSLKPGAIRHTLNLLLFKGKKRKDKALRQAGDRVRSLIQRKRSTVGVTPVKSIPPVVGTPNPDNKVAAIILHAQREVIIPTVAEVVVYGENSLVLNPLRKAMLGKLMTSTPKSKVEDERVVQTRVA